MLKAHCPAPACVVDGGRHAVPEAARAAVARRPAAWRGFVGCRGSGRSQAMTGVSSGKMLEALRLPMRSHSPRTRITKRAYLNAAIRSVLSKQAWHFDSNLGKGMWTQKLGDTR